MEKREKQLPDETDSRFLRVRYKSVDPLKEIKLVGMKLLLNFVSFKVPWGTVPWGTGHWHNFCLKVLDEPSNQRSSK